MASLASLPAELQLSIVEQLDETSNSFIPGPSPELLSLSRVCKALRNLILPFLFRNITLLNEERAGSSVLTVLTGPYSEHVRNVHYVGIMAMPSDHDDYDVPEPSGDHFPEAVEQVLSRLAELQNLERVTVQFICDRKEEDDKEYYDGAFYLLEEPETDEQVLDSEKTTAFRALMERSYRALAQNPPSSIRSLKLKDVVAKKCSAWKLPEFHTLLQNLSSFTISLRGGDNGAGWRINKMDGYHKFVGELDTYFFQHLSNIKHFSFAATDDGPPGNDTGWNSTALPLHGQHMPQLQSFHLEYVFISGHLAAFVEAHSSTLETVRLNHCYSGWGSEDAICWGDFFCSIASHKLGALKNFDVGASDLEQLEMPGKDDYYYGKTVRSEELREQFPERRMYDYKHLDDKYGMVFDSDENAFEKFESGSDHVGWQQLCKVIERDVEKDS
jgi:hypothetical protein